MNLAVTALVGYAIKEVVSPLLGELTDNTEPTSHTVTPTEKQQAQQESEGTLNFIKDLIHHII